ncbi:hypothetical protein V6N13_088737 [Hibiscus sabdariffa]
MKLAFQMDALWVRFLRSKYKCTDLVLGTLYAVNCSHLWRGLSVVWNDVKLNLKWNISDGRLVNLWFVAWVNEVGPLARYIHPTVCATLPHTFVRPWFVPMGLGTSHCSKFYCLKPFFLCTTTLLTPGLVLETDLVGWSIGVNDQSMVKLTSHGVLEKKLHSKV